MLSIPALNSTIAVYVAAFLAALALALLFTPLARRIALAAGAVDYPSERRINRVPMPRMGGLAIFAATVAVAAVFMPKNDFFWGFLAGALVIVGVGMADDILQLPAKVKFGGQILAAAVFTAFGGRIEFISNPAGGGMLWLGDLAIPLTILWIVSVVNIINLIDGVDGLAAGVSSIAALAISTVAIDKGQAGAAVMLATVAGSALGFLRYNFNPAKIFMGDTGAMFLGYALAAISVEGAVKGAATIALTVPVLALGIPVFDTFFAIVRRFKNHQPISAPDKGHLHHRLLAMGLTQRQVAFVFYSITAALGLLAIWISRQQIVYGLVALGAVAVIFGFIGLGTGVTRSAGETGSRTVASKAFPGRSRLQ